MVLPYISMLLGRVNGSNKLIEYAHYTTILGVVALAVAVTRYSMVRVLSLFLGS